MDYLTIAFIILSLIVIISLIIVLLMKWRTFTISNSSLSNPSKSIVTSTYLGRRGDMGNQLFQIACLLGAAKRSNAMVKLPSYLAMLPIAQLFDLTHLIEDVTPDHHIYEHYNYESLIIPQDGKVYDIHGYRQAYRYFQDCEQEVRTLLKPNPLILERVRKELPDKFIAVHIRKGDYVKWMHRIPLLREYKQCQIAYYKHAIDYLKSLHPGLPVIICTDSPDYVQPYLKELGASLAPTITDISPKLSDFCTLYLAQAVVISNSTYSWMAAYLSNVNRDKHSTECSTAESVSKVVCPSPWWDPDGFVGTGLALDGPYLHYPGWTFMDPETGELVDKQRDDCDSDTLSIYRLIRGFLV
jgi:hypothetical protein